ncbi:TRAP transporter permease (plasmid) [Skermanella rosea]|uniref:TRAP transporter permease n=1 Tax=Skermanella rosea TaxID=1817965 RepID=UPI0019333528|nr:TRAP transporter permease [Skermanella rosea]UEM07772.1 TRAP transporter permease [Skermanella rosea]
MSSAQRIFGYLVTAIAVSMSIYHLYVAFTGTPEVFTFRGTHLAFALVLVFLLYPVRLFRPKLLPEGQAESSLPGVMELVLVAASLAAIGYLLGNLEYVLTRYAYVEDLTTGDMVFGTLLILLVMEASRRVVGWALPATAAVFAAYALFGAGIAPQLLVDQMYLTTEGIFGIPLGVSATYVILFIIFGAMMERTGAGKLFMDFALALTGHTPGGPAKVSVITSGMFGTISGSAVANVMTTGTFTIPLMKGIGYRPAFAGAVEAVASTGGQIMPPIMGAAAFVMAEFLGVGYLQVAAYALIPAVLYYLAVFAAVHFEARRVGMVGMPRADLPRVREVLVERGHLFLPMVIIVGVLMAGFSAPYAALIGIISVPPVTLMRRTTRHEMTVAALIDALENGARNTLGVALACACAGIVIGVIAQTGLGLTFTGIVIAAAQNSLIPALVLTMLAGIILGMGMPTTPAYIVQVALLVPSLVTLGVTVEAAHMFVFYFAILSAITPPVAMAVYAANGISKAGLWDSGWAAVKLGLTGFIIPYMFVFSPSLLMIGEWYVILWSVVTATIGVVALAASLHGFLLAPLPAVQRVVMFLAALVLIKPGLVTDAVGFTLLAALVALQLAGRRTGASPAPVAESK